MSQPDVHVLPDAGAVAAEVSSMLLSRLSQLLADGDGAVHLVLTGGTIADALHRRAAARLGAVELDWRRLHVWFGDERFVDEESDDRNALQARRALTGELERRGASIHEIAGTRDATSPEQAAARYADELAAHEVSTFDLLMLGMGPDGHVASLFPGNAALAATGDVVGVHDSPKPPPERVTLTFERLNRSREVWFVASGSGKAQAVAAVIGDDATVNLPARRVTGAGKVAWFLDAEAAPRREARDGD